jgi:hypothetical protein
MRRYKGLTVQDLRPYLERPPPECTVRLHNKGELAPNSRSFGALWFDGPSDSWKVRFSNGKDRVQSLAGTRSVKEAKEVLVNGVQGYLGKGYQLTGIVSGYASPRTF